MLVEYVPQLSAQTLNEEIIMHTAIESMFIFLNFKIFCFPAPEGCSSKARFYVLQITTVSAQKMVLYAHIWIVWSAYCVQEYERNCSETHIRWYQKCERELISVLT